jgi:hypothetical protein
VGQEWGDEASILAPLLQFFFSVQNTVLMLMEGRLESRTYQSNTLHLLQPTPFESKTTLLLASQHSQKQ